MRHQRKTIKLGRSQAHRDALLSNQICSLIIEQRIKTTLAKAKAVRPYAEKMVTLGKKNTLHSRRVALANLRHNEAAVAKLFSEIAPRCANRRGGYTRIVKLGARNSDAAPMAFLEWVDAPEPEVAPEPEKKAKGKKAEKASEVKPAKAAKAEMAPEAEGTEAPAAEEGEAKKPARKPKAKKEAAE